MIYFLHGDDTYRSHKKLNELTSNLSPLLFEGERIEFGPLCEALRRTSLFDDAMMVVVKDLFSQGKNKDFEKKVFGFLSKEKAINDIIFHESQTIKTKGVIDFFSQTGKVVYFPQPNKVQVRAYVVEELKKKNVAIDRDALEFFMQNVSADLWTVSNELEKLCTVKEAGGKITKSDIEQLTTAGGQTNIFQFADALGEKKKKAGLQLLHRLLARGESPIYIHVMIVRQFRLIAQVGSLVAQKKNPKEIISELKLNPFVASKIFTQARNFSPQRVKELYTFLLEADIKLKSGSDADLTLDLLVEEICK